MMPGPPRIRRPRPVADAPIDALLARAEDLAKGWLLAVLERAPLDDAPTILAGELPRHGPRVCDAVVRALASDEDLRRLESGGALNPLVARTGELVGARDVQATTRAVGALQAVIWSAVREELSYPEPEQVSELAERLTLAIESVRVAALQQSVGEGAPRSGSSAIPAPEPPDRTAERGDESEEPPQDSGPAAAGADSAALWLNALEDEVARAAGLGAPLSLLLAELEDADRVVAVEGPGEAGATFGRFAQAVRGVVRRQDILACETDSRAWIIARDTGREGGQALGSRIAHAVGDTAPWRGAPLQVRVGLAVLGEDGTDSANLIEVAEETAFAASASGIAIVRAVAPDPPEDSGPRLVG
jgi:GGDEF domain-containing protein